MRANAAAFLFAVFFLTGSASADCGNFKWSVGQELGWFRSAPSPVASGESVPLEDRAYRLALRPTRDVQFVQPPGRPETPGAFAEIVKVEGVDPPGAYQIALSEEAWIDVVQDGARLKALDFSGQKDCPFVRKTVRFQLEKGPAVIQISNSARDSLTLAVVKAN